MLTGAHTGQPATMYDSSEARDADIDELAAAPVADVRSRLLAATTSFEQAVVAMHDQDWEGRFERTPGGRRFAVANIPLMRVREVEIHHADLGADYSAADWPKDFAVLLLDSMTKRPYPAAFTHRGHATWAGPGRTATATAVAGSPARPPISAGG